ncbi:hypothetical protein Tco_1487330, partial [Tanacetum coccineum]
KSEEGLKKALRIEKERLLDGQALLTQFFTLKWFREQFWVTNKDVQYSSVLSDQTHGIIFLIRMVSSLQGHLATALGEIRALQARDQACADAPEGTASTAVGLVFSFLVSDNHNNMPPRRSSATARAAAAARAAVAAAATST